MCRLSNKDESRRARIFCRVSLHFHFLSKEFSSSITSVQRKGQQGLGEDARGLSVFHCVPVIYLSKQISQALSERERVKGNGNDLFKQKINKENAAV